MTINPIIHNTGGIYRFSDYISQIPDFLKVEPDAVTLLQVMSDYINNAYRNVSIVKKFKIKLVAVEHNVIKVTNSLQKLADLFILAESHGTNMLFLSKVEDPTTSTPDTTQDPFNTPQTPNKFKSGAPRLIEFTASDISKVRARKVKKIGLSAFYEVFFTCTIDNVKDAISYFEMDINDDGDLTTNFLINYLNYPIPNPKLLEKLPYGFNVEFSGVRQNKVFGASLNTIKLDALASSVDNFYNGYTIKIVYGTGLNQTRTIIAYIGTSKIATIDVNWSTIPDTVSSVFVTISPQSSHLEWLKPLKYFKLDECNILDSFWSFNGVVSISGQYTSSLPIAFANTIYEYDSLKEYSADLSIDKTIGFSTSTTPIIISGISIGEIFDYLSSHIQAGLSIQSSGLYFTIFKNDILLYNKIIIDTIPITPELYARKVKILFNSNSLDVYLNDELRYTIKETTLSTKLGFITIQNISGCTSTGFIDNIYIENKENDINLNIEEVTVSGSGLFYARDLTNIDKTTEFIDFNTGVNKYQDPLFYKLVPNPVPSLQYDFLVDNFNYPYLRIPYNNSFGLPFQIGDSLSRLDNTYFVRLATTTSLPACIYTSNSTLTATSMGILTIDGVNISIGDRILIKDQLDSIQDGIYIVMDDGTINPFILTRTSDILYTNPKVFVTAGILNINLAFKIETIDSIIIGAVQVDTNTILLNNSSAKIIEITPTYLIVDLYIGDWVSVGEFVKVLSGSLVLIPSLSLANIDSLAKPWDSSITYTIGSKVTYNNIKYKVLQSHFASYSETPEINHKFYIINMFDDNDPPNKLITYAQKLQTNPYMFGTYKVTHIPINEEPDFIGEGFSGLYDNLYIQPAEELDIKFRTLQRDWLFNPRIASNIELRRNGWMEVLLYNDAIYDIPTVTTTSPITDGSIVFTKQNLFDITDNNPELATISTSGDGWYKYTFNKIDFQKTTSYDSTLFPVTRILENNDELNVNTNVDSLKDERSISLTTPVDIVTDFTVSGNTLVLVSAIPPIPAGSKVLLTSTGSQLPGGLKKSIPYYVIDVDNTGLILKLSTEFNGPLIILDNSISGTPLATHTINKKFIQTIYVKNGNVVNLTSQTNSLENGKWRVVNNGNWIRLTKKTVLKISDIVIDFSLVDDLALADDPIKYTVYTDLEKNTFISTPRVQSIYVIEKGFATNFRFTLEKVDGIDTTVPFNLQYDARYDSNTVADVSKMDKSFKGVPDMKYPLVEKIERLVYQKDPSVIDLELLGYLARFMGYDITQISDDISESNLYSSDKERELALRRMIQNLPQYYSLRATESGLESILLAFGVVGEVIRRWTSQDDPYAEFIDEDKILDRQYTDRENGVIIDLIPTPHFFLKINIDSALDTDINNGELIRARENVIRYKPINTVFDGIILYLTTTLKQRMSLSPVLGTVYFSTDIGYDIDFSEIDNGC